MELTSERETLQKIKWLTIKGAITIPIEFIEPPIICLCNAVVFPTEETDKYKLRTTCNTAAEIPITKEPIKKVKKPNGIPVPIIFNSYRNNKDVVIQPTHIFPNLILI